MSRVLKRVDINCIPSISTHTIDPHFTAFTVPLKTSSIQGHLPSLHYFLHLKCAYFLVAFHPLRPCKLNVLQSRTSFFTSPSEGYEIVPVRANLGALFGWGGISVPPQNTLPFPLQPLDYPYMHSSSSSRESTPSSTMGPIRSTRRKRETPYTPKPKRYIILLHNLLAFPHSQLS